MSVEGTNHLEISGPAVFDLADCAQQLMCDSLDALMALKEFDCECDEKPTSIGGPNNIYTDVDFKTVTKGLAKAILFVKQYRLDFEISPKPFSGEENFWKSLSEFGIVSDGDDHLVRDEVVRQQFLYDAARFEGSLQLIFDGLKHLSELSHAGELSEVEQAERKARSSVMKTRYEKLQYFRDGRDEFFKSFGMAIPRKDWEKYSFLPVGKASVDASVAHSATIFGSGPGANFSSRASATSQSPSHIDTRQSLTWAEEETITFTPRFAIALAQGHVPEDLLIPFQLLSTQTSLGDSDNAKAAALCRLSPGFRAAQDHLAKVLQSPPIAQRLTPKDMLQLMRDLNAGAHS
ncbi:hypothetical protein NCC49_000386 [Naganishia albida]|nr:hypothetical protein NCC49_000386 [Naganishia albida]